MTIGQIHSQPYTPACLGVYFFFDSEEYQGRFKESNNLGIKVQVKRTFKSYSFLSRKKTPKKSKYCDLLPQSFRITLKDTSSNISIDPIDLSTFYKFY